MIKKGVTLVELLVSSLLLVIVITGVMMVYTSNSKMLAQNKKRNIAMRYLNNELEGFNHLTARNDILAKIDDGKWEIPYTTENGTVINYEVEVTHKNYFINNADHYSGMFGKDPVLLELDFSIKWDHSTIKKKLITNPGLN